MRWILEAAERARASSWRTTRPLSGELRCRSRRPRNRGRAHRSCHLGSPHGSSLFMRCLSRTTARPLQIPDGRPPSELVVDPLSDAIEGPTAHF
eukprot:648760-Prymnesium_polylepis.1